MTFKRRRRGRMRWDARYPVSIPAALYETARIGSIGCGGRGDRAGIDEAENIFRRWRRTRRAVTLRRQITLGNSLEKQNPFVRGAGRVAGGVWRQRRVDAKRCARQLGRRLQRTDAA